MTRKLAQVLFDAFPLKGGLDLHTPQLSLPAGVARDAQNWEASINGGYSRIAGYERFDGRTSPTTAQYVVVDCGTIAGLSVGDSVNGATSGATGVVAAFGTTGTYIAVTKVVGTFVVGENFRKAPTTVIGVLTVVSPTITDQVQLATFALAAAGIYRADITAVPGSGSILGVTTFNSVVYAFRNNAGGTAAALYKSSSTGWQAVTLPYEVSFSTGATAAPAEGSTLTRGGITAVIRRVVVESGSFSGGNAAGRFITDAPSGSFTAGAATFPGGTCTLTAGLTGGLVQSQVTLLPGGRFEFSRGNAGNGVRTYGADGVNRGFEFDGAVFVPIKTGMTADTPLHVHVHLHMLFFSFLASSQNSSLGAPYQWSPITGAGEIALDQNIVGYVTLPGNNDAAALAILGNDTVSVLYGTSAATFVLIPMAQAVGAKAYSAQQLNQTYIYDDNGIVSLSAVKEFGNFASTSLTVNLRQFVQNRRNLVTDSCINQEKSQYRVFYSDGYALYMTIVNGRLIGAMPQKFPNAVKCIVAGESTNGAEVSYFGSTNGLVYKLDTGTSFDGAVIDHFFSLAYSFQGNARIRKRYRKAVFELQGTAYGEFSAGYTFSYGNQAVVSTAQASTTTPVYWDQFTWDQFVWDGTNISPTALSLEGSGENLSLRIEGSSALWPSFTINSVTLHYSPRRILR